MQGFRSRDGIYHSPVFGIARLRHTTAAFAADHLLVGRESNAA